MSFRYTGAIASLSAEDRLGLTRRVKENDSAVRDATSAIIERVRLGGDSALVDLALELDGVTLGAIEVPRGLISAALSSLAPELVAALERAARNIASVHSAQLPEATEVEPEPGVIVGRRPDALGRVGCYAPGGRAAYASSVLMCAIPARIAGVGEIVVCSPAGPSGLPSQIVLAACAIAKVDRVFAVGGAGAVAAMAFGTESIPSVDKIVGPGNAYVAEAKVQLSRVVGIDSPAGPSELLVICDESCDADAMATEIIAQAEHAPDACVVVIASSSAVCERVSGSLEKLVDTIPRAETARAALESNGAMLVSGDDREAIAFAADYAPEHLLLAVAEAERIAGSVRNAGCVFVGETSSVVFGDYITGGNHVLPTAGTAHSYSGLGVADFVRWTGYQRVTPEAAARLSSDTAILANAEGLGGHAAAALRLMETGR